MALHPFSGLPVPPALVYLLHQLREHKIGYQLYGEIPDTDMSFVDIERKMARGLNGAPLPEHWSIVSPHFMAHRALEQGQVDPITDPNQSPEAVVFAFGGREAQDRANFRALVDQVRFLRQQTPSRLIYHSRQPPEPMEIQALIARLKASE